MACFSKQKSSTDGKHRWCKDCANTAKRDWHAKNKADQNAKSLAYYNENKDELKPKMVENYYENRGARISYKRRYDHEKKDEIRARRLERYSRNKEKFRAQARSWAKENRHKASAANAKRRATLARAALNLSDDHKNEVYDIYWLARDLKACTGYDYHVDHIIPLNGKGICGLHVPWNLQILPSHINQRKYNHADYDAAFAFCFK